MSGLVFIILIWTIAMNHFQVELCSFMPLLCRKFPPLRCFFVVLWNSFCRNIKVNYLNLVIFKVKNLLTTYSSNFFLKWKYPQFIHYKKNLITFFPIKIFFIHSSSPKNIFYSQFFPKSIFYLQFIPIKVIFFVNFLNYFLKNFIFNFQ